MKKNKLFGLATLLVATLSILALGSCPSPASGNPDNMLTVTYHANGEAVTVPAVQRALPGTAVYVAAMPDYDPAVVAKYFNGWNTEADGSGGLYVHGEPMTVDENIDLYAEWIESGMSSATGELTVVMQPFVFAINGYYGILVPDLIDMARVEPDSTYTVIYSFSSNVALDNLHASPADATGNEPPRPGSEFEWMVENGFPNIIGLGLPGIIETDIPANTEVSG